MNFEAKGADFGLAKFTVENNTHVSTRVMGTFGHLASRIANSTPKYTAAPYNNYQYMLRTSSTPNNIQPQQHQQPFLTKAPSFNSSSTTENINFPNQNDTQIANGTERMEQHAIQQILHDMVNGSSKRVIPQQSASAVYNATTEVQSSDVVAGPAVDGKSGAATTPSWSNNYNSSSSSSNFSEMPDVLCDFLGWIVIFCRSFVESFQWWSL